MSSKMITQLELLNRKIDKMNVGQSSKNIHVIQGVRDSCREAHASQECPVVHQDDSHEAVHFVSNQSRQNNNPYSNTYNPGWRNHPNFYWNNNHGGVNASRSNVPPRFQNQVPTQQGFYSQQRP